MTGYDKCFEANWRQGNAYARAKVYFTNLTNLNKVRGDYVIGDRAIAKVGKSGSQDTWHTLYFIEGYGWVNCYSSGCNAPYIFPGTYVLANQGESFSSCYAFMSWEEKETSSCWSWVSSGTAFDKPCKTMKVVECSEDIDCPSSTQMCDKSGDWTTWKCKIGTPEPTEKIFYRLQNNQCNQISILESEKTINDYSTLQECESQRIIEPTQPGVSSISKFFQEIWTWIKWVFGA